jgi:argininosuccinate lyase
MLYERHAIDRLGPEAGGAAHVARSRNDLNATVARMRLRDQLLALLRAGGELAGTALGLVREHAGTLMSGFTHFQPAQPATLGHYLAGFASELLRTLELLSGAFDNVNRSPLGACAGWGTSFPIDPERTASLLGFDAVIANSLDAVASRDYAIQVLAALSSLGILLTRLSLDLQTWGSHAYGFLRWPDRLVSTSSIMPAAGPAGALSATLLALKSTPFSNSVEAGSEALVHLWPALSGARTAVQLMELMLREVEVDAGRMSRFLAGGEVTMTALADHLVERLGLPFRTAHEAVGNLLQRLPDEGTRSVTAIRESLEEILRDLTGRGVSLEDAGIARALDPLACVQAARHGGGPAPESVEVQLAGLDEARRSLCERTAAWRRRLDQSEARLDEAVSSLLDSYPPEESQR